MMSVSAADLASIPLFQDIHRKHLSALMDVLEHSRYEPGHVLFQKGDSPNELLVLVDGRVELRDGDQTLFTLLPVAPVGELGSVTGIARNTTAVVTEPSEIWWISTKALMAFFEAHGDVAFRFYHNLLALVANKVTRDARRVSEMRDNIIRTQKEMKALRELLLSGPDTPLAHPFHDRLAVLIEQNRKAHYSVQPVRSLPAFIRFDDGAREEVIELTDASLRFRVRPDMPLEPSQEWQAVLVLTTGEVPICGRVTRCDESSVCATFDRPIEQYAVVLDDYLTRLHMLDFVV